MCVLVWLVEAMLNLWQAFEKSLGKSPGCFCITVFDRANILPMILLDYPVFFVSYGVTTFCYYKIYRFLKSHQNQPTSLGQQSRLREDRSLLKYIGAAATLPFATDTPFAMVIALRL